MRKVALDERFDGSQVGVRHAVVPGQAVFVPKHPKETQEAGASGEQIAERAQHILTGRRNITAEASHLKPANHHSRRAAPENGEQAEVLKVDESEREKADRGAEFVESKVSAQGAEESEETAVGECQTSRIDQQGAATVIERGNGKQSGMNRGHRLDVRLSRLFPALRRDGNINEQARVLPFLLMASPADGDRESKIVGGCAFRHAATFHL